ncbi:achaete-scute complex protein T3 [Drosophila simulans]|uniref:Lethal of scute n=1 Tax=Drosophila simulans TaxID=7240 RepID=O77032_DROSI|nr:achaete-scute complex protein T3 [Drosophila simulans]EDX16748.1 lethal of scute [Drosophila simulans]KMZ07480.1 lethal of scute [Drosophila simulans]BAA33213.1 lethal of scute [Drosophila simulans]
MTSICSSKFQQQHYQLTNSNIFLLQHQHHHQTQQHQLIAPKIPLGTSQLQNMQHGQQSNVGPMLSSQKKKFNYNNMPYGEQLPSVARRNARERNRVKQVNNGFVNLRQHLPQTVVNSLSNGGRGTSKKLSKVDTLRIAVEYIRGLQDMLDDGTASSSRHIYNSADESSNDGSSYNDYNDSLDSSQQFLMGATQSAQSHSYHSASPTPSYSGSEISGGGYIKQELQEQDLKFDSFDSFSDEQPDDEELLDYISSWQEQ